MLDIKYLVDNEIEVKENLKLRGFDINVIDAVLSLNQKRKELTTEVEKIKAQVNQLSRKVGELKKAKENADELMKEVQELKAKSKDNENTLNQINIEQKDLLLTVPNLVNKETTPVGADENENVEFKKWGEPRNFDFKVLDHADLGEKLGMLDFETAAKITGARFAIYKKGLARLERALANFMLDHHLEKGFEEVIPPFIVHERALVGTGNLPKFGDQLFKLEGNEWFLIPTAEVPVTNFQREKILNSDEFPFKYTAYTPCFRSEAGSHGKDVKGLIRMHQFNKVEMVCITKPDQSRKIHEEMVQSSCEILEKLQLPYRAVNLCTGDIGFASEATVDLEVWIPSQEKYREIASISNCGAFQARRAMIRFRNSDGKPEFAHTLNGSGLAVGRTLLAIMENYQQEDGSILIPEALLPYMGGLKELKA